LARGYLAKSVACSAGVEQNGKAERKMVEVENKVFYIKYIIIYL